jgi:hypothetical protein
MKRFGVRALVGPYSKFQDKLKLELGSVLILWCWLKSCLISFALFASWREIPHAGGAKPAKKNWALQI